MTAIYVIALLFIETGKSVLKGSGRERTYEEIMNNPSEETKKEEERVRKMVEEWKREDKEKAIMLGVYGPWARRELMKKKGLDPDK